MAKLEASTGSLNRRDFLVAAGTWTMNALVAGKLILARAAADTVTLPFANGERDLVAYPQKRPLIRLTSRPPQLETPFSVFNEGLITANDAFFVRYHLSGIPTSIDPAKHRIRIGGLVDTPLNLSIADLKAIGEPIDLVAVNQCSGNSRGFFSPRVPGGQLGNGAMGNARWTGVPLKKVLERAGVKAGARQVTFKGLDRAPIEATPAFVKALDLDHALDGEVMIAFAMNGVDIPMLNGFPVKLVVPGYYGTYWVKHLSEIEVVGEVFGGFWMSTSYRIPDNPGHCIEPGQTGVKTIPINRLNVRSFITSLGDGSRDRVRRRAGHPRSPFLWRRGSKLAAGVAWRGSQPLLIPGVDAGFYSAPEGDLRAQGARGQSRGRDSAAQATLECSGLHAKCR
jgi:sulfite dehydrogenase (cytochrome) subunit A